MKEYKKIDYISEEEKSILDKAIDSYLQSITIFGGIQIVPIDYVDSIDSLYIGFTILSQIYYFENDSIESEKSYLLKSEITLSIVLNYNDKTKSYEYNSRDNDLECYDNVCYTYGDEEDE